MRLGVWHRIIVNELVTNALKHAFQEGANGRIRIGSTFDNNGVCIIVEDNGRGIDGARATGGNDRNGLGTRLVERFIRQLGAKHGISSSEDGTMHRVTAPTLD